ncbi:hypothetical protein MR813_00035 [bacterium]|nr:hypothetical protein [bacterium]
MRFVAGRGAVAERLQRGGAVAELLLAAAPWRSCCRQGTVGTEDNLPEQ